MKVFLKKPTLSTVFIYIILISIAISPAFALGEGNRNLILICIMCFSPIYIILKFRIYSNDILILLFILSIVIFPMFFHPESMRWSTVLYSIMFCLTFMAYYRLLNNGKFKITNYFNIIKYLIIAYFLVLLIQQFCVLTGTPIFNLSNYNPAEPWKLNSLSSEPSHSARIVGLLMFCYITIKELIKGETYIFVNNFHEDKWIWFAFIWTMVTMGSATSFIFIPIILLKFVSFKNLTPLIIISIISIILIQSLQINTVKRIYDVISATMSLNEDKIIKTDHSAAIRIVPFIIETKSIEFLSSDGWFGHGIDYVRRFLYHEVPGFMKDTSAGGMMQVILEYGILAASLFFVFSLRMSVSWKDYLSIIFWILLVFLNSINSQIVWLAIILLFTNKYFRLRFTRSLAFKI